MQNNSITSHLDINKNELAVKAYNLLRQDSHKNSDIILAIICYAAKNTITINKKIYSNKVTIFWKYAAKSEFSNILESYKANTLKKKLVVH